MIVLRMVGWWQQDRRAGQGGHRVCTGVRVMVVGNTDSRTENCSSKGWASACVKGHDFLQSPDMFPTKTRSGSTNGRVE